MRGYDSISKLQEYRFMESQFYVFLVEIRIKFVSLEIALNISVLLLKYMRYEIPNLFFTISFAVGVYLLLRKRDNRGYT